MTQTKIYGFEVMGDIAQEKLVGFELKKNLSVHYRDRSLLDKLVVTAARSKIYDLIKVDYVVKDVNLVQEKLMEEASKVIKQKVARYDRLLGIQAAASRPDLRGDPGSLLPDSDVRLVHGGRIGVRGGKFGSAEVHRPVAQGENVRLQRSGWLMGSTR